jgi:hypothetical protein
METTNPASIAIVSIIIRSCTVVSSLVVTPPSSVSIHHPSSERYVNPPGSVTSRRRGIREARTAW